MKIFGNINSNSEVTRSTSTKRDVTISNEPKKRPDHVKVETRDSVWKIPLTLEEQYALGQLYEGGTDNEQQMLTSFTESLYQGSAARLTVEIMPWRPGEVFMQASGGNLFKKSSTVPYEEIGRIVCEWIVESQKRKELIADLVAALPGEQG